MVDFEYSVHVLRRGRWDVEEVFDARGRNAAISAARAWLDKESGSAAGVRVLRSILDGPQIGDVTILEEYSQDYMARADKAKAGAPGVVAGPGGAHARKLQSAKKSAGLFDGLFWLVRHSGFSLTLAVTVISSSVLGFLILAAFLGHVLIDRNIFLFLMGGIAAYPAHRVLELLRRDLGPHLVDLFTPSAPPAPKPAVPPKETQVQKDFAEVTASKEKEEQIRKAQFDFAGLISLAIENCGAKAVPPSDPERLGLALVLLGMAQELEKESGLPGGALLSMISRGLGVPIDQVGYIPGDILHERAINTGRMFVVDSKTEAEDFALYLPPLIDSFREQGSEADDAESGPPVAVFIRIENLNDADALARAMSVVTASAATPKGTAQDLRISFDDLDGLVFALRRDVLDPEKGDAKGLKILIDEALSSARPSKASTRTEGDDATVHKATDGGKSGARDAAGPLRQMDAEERLPCGEEDDAAVDRILAAQASDATGQPAKDESAGENDPAETLATHSAPEGHVEDDTTSASDDVGFDHFALIEVMSSGGVFATERIVQRFPSAGAAFSEGGMYPISRESNVLIKLHRLGTQDRQPTDRHLSDEVREFVISDRD